MAQNPADLLTQGPMVRRHFLQQLGSIAVSTAIYTTLLEIAFALLYSVGIDSIVTVVLVAFLHLYSRPVISQAAVGNYEFQSCN